MSQPLIIRNPQGRRIGSTVATSASHCGVDHPWSLYEQVFVKAKITLSRHLLQEYIASRRHRRILQQSARGPQHSKAQFLDRFLPHTRSHSAGFRPRVLFKELPLAFTLLLGL